MKFSGTVIDALDYYTGIRVHIFGRLDYGTGRDRWIGTLHGVTDGITGGRVAVLAEDGHDEDTIIPVCAVREIRPAGR
jgi:hypothetical protein